MAKKVIRHDGELLNRKLGYEQKKKGRKEEKRG